MVKKACSRFLEVIPRARETAACILTRPSGYRCIQAKLVTMQARVGAALCTTLRQLVHRACGHAGAQTMLQTPAGAWLPDKHQAHLQDGAVERLCYISAPGWQEAALTCGAPRVRLRDAGGGRASSSSSSSFSPSQRFGLGARLDARRGAPPACMPAHEEQPDFRTNCLPTGRTPSICD